MDAFGPSQSKKSYSGKPLRVAGKTYGRGIGTHAESRFLLKIDRKASRFTALVGLDDHASANLQDRFPGGLIPPERTM